MLCSEITIRDAILTCAQKLTWVSLIYYTEPTIKKWKQKKVKSIKRICSEVSVNSPRNPWSQSWRRKGRLRWEGLAEKEGFEPGIKEWEGDGILIASMNVSGVTIVHDAADQLNSLATRRSREEGTFTLCSRLYNRLDETFRAFI